MFHRQSAFSVIELMIVIAIIADLAIIAVPAWIRARDYAQEGAFINDLRVAVDAIQQYAVENGKYPPDASKARTPTGMDQYVGTFDFTAKNSLGAQWQWDAGKSYATAAISIVFPTNADPERMLAIDERIDNGIVSTGSFRRRNSKQYYLILE